MNRFLIAALLAALPLLSVAQQPKDEKGTRKAPAKQKAAPERPAPSRTGQAPSAPKPAARAAAPERPKNTPKAPQPQAAKRPAPDPPKARPDAPAPTQPRAGATAPKSRPQPAPNPPADPRSSGNRPDMAGEGNKARPKESAKARPAEGTAKRPEPRAAMRPETSSAPTRPTPQQAARKGNPPTPQQAAAREANRAEAERIQRARTQARARAQEDAETRRILQDQRRLDAAQQRHYAREIEDDDDAKTLLYSVLGGAAGGFIGGNLASRNNAPDPRGRYHRLDPALVGRDPRDRDRSVDYLSRRFGGHADWHDAPPGYHGHYDHYHNDGHHYPYQPHYYEGDRRVVYYRTYETIPPVLLASRQLDYVDVTTVSESPYRPSAAPAYQRNLPETYVQDEAYALSYEVDPDSAVILDDILFAQGSTDFADAYSYDLVVDLAEAMNSSDIVDDRFVDRHGFALVAEANLALSQERAERIARDLVSMGVAPDRLVPVGYGETEAQFADSSSEEERSLDRRVMVFRLK